MFVCMVNGGLIHKGLIHGGLIVGGLWYFRASYFTVSLITSHVRVSEAKGKSYSEILLHAWLGLVPFVFQIIDPLAGITPHPYILLQSMQILNKYNDKY